jgi:GntR family transcriptional repressor for pyruvate dehydrogenase complex
VLTTIQRTNVVDEIVDQLMAYVAELRPGDRIPAERQLVRQLGVSRSSMREALRVLIARGLLEVREGLGTFVAENHEPFIGNALLVSSLIGGRTARDLHEVRAYVEPFCARLAAERATEADLDAVAATLARQEATLDSVEGFLEADVAFHLAVAQASQNRVLVEMLRAVRALSMARMATLLTVRRDMPRAYGDHRRIHAAIAARDPAGAEAAMHAHLAPYSDVFRADEPTDAR